MATTKNKVNVLEYKGRPLIRHGNIAYYGNITDKYIIMIQILETQKVDDLEVASKVSIQLQHTDPSIKSKDMVVKKSEKNGFYEALDVASIWLERALAEK